MIKKLKSEHPTATNFFHHFIRNLIFGFSVLLVILIIGILGNHYFEKANWTDSFTNAAMIVSGVGTLEDPRTDLGKIFIGVYSILGGASFLLVIAVVFAPIFHWLFRQVNVEDREHFKD
jgi:hypothetical protein